MIYFISDGYFIKIGKCEDPYLRLSQLQIGNPRELKIVAVMDGDEDQEAYLHNLFQRHHFRGEWFKATTKIYKYIMVNGRQIANKRVRSNSIQAKIIERHPIDSIDVRIAGRKNSILSRVDYEAMPDSEKSKFRLLKSLGY